jgi:hypothetical protein
MIVRTEMGGEDTATLLGEFGVICTGNVGGRIEITHVWLRCQ